jgi:hypothetical protein
MLSQVASLAFRATRKLAAPQISSAAGNVTILILFSSVFISLIEWSIFVYPMIQF